MTKNKVFWTTLFYVLAFSCGNTLVLANNPSHKTEGMKDTNVDDRRFSFRSHGFAALAFNTRGCTVVYADRYQLRNRDNPSSPRPEVGRMRVGGYHIGIANFPKPALVSWKSLDGEEHLASIDMSSIFRDQKILHAVPKEDVAPKTYIGDPNIVLVVDDRVITVYMHAHIPVKELQIPGNKYSDFVDDFILAYKKNY